MHTSILDDSFAQEFISRAEKYDNTSLLAYVFQNGIKFHCLIDKRYLLHVSKEARLHGKNIKEFFLKEAHDQGVVEYVLQAFHHEISSFPLVSCGLKIVPK